MVWTLQLNRANFNIQLGFWTELQSKTYLLGLDFTSGPSQFLLKVEKRSFWKILLFSFHLDFFHKASLCSNDKICKEIYTCPMIFDYQSISLTCHFMRLLIKQEYFETWNYFLIFIYSCLKLHCTVWIFLGTLFVPSCVLTLPQTIHFSAQSSLKFMKCVINFFRLWIF